MVWYSNGPGFAWNCYPNSERVPLRSDSLDRRNSISAFSAASANDGQCPGRVSALPGPGRWGQRNLMRITGCNSMSFGAAPVVPVSLSKKPSPRTLTVR